MQKQINLKANRQLKLFLKKNFNGVFFKICWCGVAYPTLIFLPICISFSIMGLLKQTWDFSLKELELNATVFPLCSLMFLIALWIFKRFPTKIYFDNDFLKISYAIPLIFIKYRTQEVKLTFKIANMGFDYGKVLHLKTKYDPLPIAIMSPIYDGDWSRIQDFVYNLQKQKVNCNKSKLNRIESKKKKAR